jgi:hypothetical protein
MQCAASIAGLYSPRFEGERALSFVEPATSLTTHDFNNST